MEEIVYKDVFDALAAGESAASAEYNAVKYNNGTAIGKLSSVTDDDVNSSKFECAWPAEFDNGINMSTSNSSVKFRIPEIQHGEIKITPIAANEPTEAEVTFPKKFSGPPHVIVTPYTGAPGTMVTEASVSGIPTATGFTACLTRTNTTATTLAWIAIY